YVVQSIAMGLSGGALGALLGSVLAKLLPGILNNFLPVDVQVTLSPKAILLGIALGLVITLLFSLTPLLKLNKMTAGDSLKSSIDIDSVKTKWVWGVWLAIIALILGFSVFNAHRIIIGLAMGGGLIVSIGLLVLMAFLLMFAVKKLIPDLLPFVWKQGLKNLYRPQNQTLTAVVSLGLGTFMISILYLSQENILQQVRSAEEGNSPNMVLFDIQVDQVEKVKGVINDQGLTTIDMVPIVSMRLKTLNGKDVKVIREENSKLDREDRIPNWTLQRTYRSTYRSKLNSGERILEGNFVPKVDMQDVMDGKIKVPVSVESGILESMKLKLGDTMTFDLGGIDIPCVIASVRYVEWMKMRPNFFVVFPDGLLNDAPQMIVAVTKTADSKESAKLQAEITKQFSNISVLDLSLVVKTVQSMLDKASLAVKIMAGFSILTGLVILICSLHLSQLQRLKDNTLLKVLGSSRKQVMSIMFSEFSFLALLGANAGTILAYAANFALSEFIFENHLPINWEVLIFANVILLSLTLSIGFLISRKTYVKTSLEVLREET
ncbi:MAG: FtsX-like permease family protein, partial [Lentisphaeraceae bacterium]|nr:FtsX-like permease family protein [Lentisphaeraceae bacterium]